MRSANAVLSALCLAAAVACGGGSSTQTTAQRTPEPATETPTSPAKSAEDIAKSAQDMAKGFEAMAKGMAGAGGGDYKPVEPVDFHNLQALLPELDGWTRGKPTGEKMNSPVSFAQAKVRYTRGNAEIETKITDSGFNQLIMAPFTMFLATGFERETEGGYEKSTKVGVYPGWEKWQGRDKEGELNALIGKRFLVQIEGNDIDDTKPLHTIMARIDLDKLAAMK